MADPGVQQKRKKDKHTFKNTSEEAITDEVKVLGKVFYKNVINYSVEELSKLAGLGPCLGKEPILKPGKDSHDVKDSQGEDGKDVPNDNPAVIIDKLKIIRFKMGSMASRNILSKKFNLKRTTKLQQRLGLAKALKW